MPEEHHISSGSLAETAAILRHRILDAKRRSAGFEWYPYDSLASVPRIIRLLDVAAGQHVLDSGLNAGVLDLGCGDGEMSFLFEAAGCEVTAIDYPVTNHNGMKGVHALKQMLDSRVRIIAADVDNVAAPVSGPMGVALCLGLLYHLKNPFLVLEYLAHTCRYCLLSTRVARCLPNGQPFPDGQPIAYLVNAAELNADETNFWIFSHEGLDRLLKRAHWEVLSSFSAGSVEGSDPVRPDKDERVFCLLKSHYGLANIDLLYGWHDVEDSGWRWTARKFSFAGRFESGWIPEILRMRLFVTAAIMEHGGDLVLSGAANGIALPSLRLDKPGEHLYEVRLRVSERSLTFTFELDRSRPPSADDPRELGFIVAAVDFH